MLDSAPTPSTLQAYLGPGEVVNTAPLRTSLEDQRVVDVQAAFTFPYQPELGDRLLLTGQEGTYYAIGVLSGAGKSTLDLPGDVELLAQNGTLTLAGDEGLELRSPSINLNADLLRTFAGSLSEQADTAYRWIKDRLTIRAGESHRTVEGLDQTRAKESVTLAEGNVKIDGHQVFLGQ